MLYRIISIKRPLFRKFKNKCPSLETFCYFLGKHVYTPFELLDEDIVEAAPSFNLIDEGNGDEELKILSTF